MNADNTDSLQSVLLDLARARVDLNDFEGDAWEAVFDMYTTESALAGISTRISQASSIPSLSAEENTMIHGEFLRGTMWIRRDGSSHDLSAHEDLLHYGSRIDALRRTLASIAKTS